MRRTWILVPAARWCCRTKPAVRRIRIVLFTSGKEGRMYLLDRQALGGVQVGADSGALASLPVAGSQSPLLARLRISMAPSTLVPSNSPLLAFPVAGASLGVLAIGFDLERKWLSRRDTQHFRQRLERWDRMDHHREMTAAGCWPTMPSDLSGLYDSNALPSDQLPGYAEFSVPTIADGKVFAGYRQRRRRLRRIGAGCSRDCGSHERGQLLDGCDFAGIADLRVWIEPGCDHGERAFGSAAHVDCRYVGDHQRRARALLFESPGQINAQVPWELAGGSGDCRGANSRSFVASGERHRFSPPRPGFSPMRAATPRRSMPTAP